MQELLHFLEQKNITQITQVKARHISDFSNYLKGRRNQTQGGGLSASHINKALQSINTFAKYLEQTGRHNLDIVIRKIGNEINERIILTQEEIKKLYESTYEPHLTFNSLAMGQRDRAIIAMLYGCGLRKNEGTKLNITDIDLNKKLVFVRKGKGNKQRYVPIANKHAEDIRAYIEEGRYWFLEDHGECAFYYRDGKPRPKKQNPDKEAFFLNLEGKRMCSFYQRLAYMKERAGIEKHFSTHNLRHSIATHLLQSGMPIDEIAKFLGHSSLESTQIYTHIVNKLNNKNNEHHEF